jgi:hypothetical protein
MENLLEKISVICQYFLPILLSIILPVLVLVVRHLINKLTYKMDVQTKAALNDLLTNLERKDAW